MARIFISYRRADSQHVTDRLCDHMQQHFGVGNVFQDVDNIPFGVDFRQYLAGAVADCDAVLVVIGPDWANHIRQRAGQANDFVRIEVESALTQGKLVVPVLVKGAAMPGLDDVPASIQQLCWLNAAHVRRNPDFRRDCQILAEGVQRVLKRQGAAPPASQVLRAADILPGPFEWIEIPAGPFLMGSDPAKDSAAQDDEQPQITVNLPAYHIAKYPITNAQFAKFIEAGGYDRREWWTAAGWQACEKEGWTEPDYWQDSEWNGAEYPVVGVSWVESMAFCLWLSEVSGEKIMLPTEPEWEKAARGTDGRLYPWGDQPPDESRCNFDRNVGQTTPVTQYPAGASPYGVLDMAGNVWEWCLTKWGWKYAEGPETMDNDSAGASARVVRGGSRFSYQSRARASCRYYSQLNRPFDLGFRVCCVVRPPS